ncbi:MAG: glycoside hydrolase domain-containing protein [Planctomycetota bacterium]
MCRCKKVMLIVFCVVCLSLTHLCSGDGFEPGDFAMPRIVVPMLPKAPPVEADIDQAYWKSAAKIPGFINYNTGEPGRFETVVHIGYCSDAIYLAFRCYAPAGTKPVTEITQFDGNVNKDDCVEIFLIPPQLKGQQEYYQFLLSPKNIRCDLFGTERSWNGVWDSATKILDDGWIAVIKIPFSTLGLSSPSSMKFAMVRTAVAPEDDRTVFPWSGRQWYYNGPDLAGTLVLEPGVPAVALTKKSYFRQGNIALEADAVVLPKEGFTNSTLTILTRDNKVVATDTQQPRFDSRQVVHQLSDIPDGLFKLRYTFSRADKAIMPAYYGGQTTDLDTSKVKDGNNLVVIEWPLVVDKKAGIDVVLKLRDRGETLDCQLQARGVFDVDSNTVYTFTVLDEQGKEVVARLGTMPYKAGKIEYRQKLPDLPERSRYKLHVSLSQQDKVVVEETVGFATSPKPKWLDNTDGIPDQVPDPWQVISLEGRTVSVWGREYEFEQGPVPSQVYSKKTALLHEPCRLLLEPMPKSWQLLCAKPDGPIGAPAAAVFEWQSEDSPVTYTASTRIEFDGTVRVDLRIPRNAKVSRYALEIPYKKDLAKFIHRGPGRFGGFFTTYWLPGERQTHEIIPNYYLLNDDGGLCWFDGMPFDWRLTNPKEAMELIPRKEDVLVRVNYIDDDKVYDIDRTFTFGLQAMPARPMPENTRGLRSSRHYKYGYEDVGKHPAWFSTVDYWSDGNIEMDAGTMEIWVRPDFDPAVHKQTEQFLLVSHGPGYQMVLQWEPGGFGITGRIKENWSMNIVSPSRIDLEPGKWTHVAMTWGEEVVLYVDGKAVNTSSPRKGTMKIDPVNIYAGGKKVFVDGLRISSVPRSSFDLTEPPAADSDTLLLDNFDKFGWVNGRRATLPEKVSAVAEAGYLSPDAHLTAGKWGQGVDSMKVPVRSVVEGLAFLGTKQIMFHAGQYTDEACAGLYIKDEKAFRKAVEAIHGLGMDVIVYVNNSLSNWDRMWDTYADSMLIEPRGTPFIQPGIPDEKTYQACPYSEYGDYWFWRLGRLMDEYGVNGFFLDGRMYTRCKNTAHGCGITNFEGDFVAKRDIWKGRLNQWRMYNVIKNRGGYCEQHKSSQWDAPTCFFWDCVWEGEQLMGQKRDGRKNLEIMPLVAMRAQMNGMPYGMPVRNESHCFAPFTQIELCTYTFVHGLGISETYRLDEILVDWPFWKAKGEFGANLHDFVGYWAQKPPAKSVPDELIKVSAHVKPGKALVMIANFNEDKPGIEGRVKLNLENLGLKKPKACDAFSSESVELENGNTLNVSIKSFRQAWYILED